MSGKRELTQTEWLALARKHKFKPGQRVRLSQYGKDSNIGPITRRDQSGVVTKVDEFNSPTVLWDGRKTAAGYFPGFIEPDRRRRS